MDHKDLMERINGGKDPEPKGNTQEHPAQMWRDMDRRAGHTRFEALVSIEAVTRCFKRLFKNNESV